jgi:hypothetical protein
MHCEVPPPLRRGPKHGGRLLMDFIRRGQATIVFALLAIVAASATGGASAAGVTAADPSDVVLVLDFSGSILDDKSTRTKFANALDAIAGRIEETADILQTGEATVSILWFATRAADFPKCTGLNLKDDLAAVIHLSDCLRSVGNAFG